MKEMRTVEGTLLFHTSGIISLPAHAHHFQGGELVTQILFPTARKKLCEHGPETSIWETMTVSTKDIESGIMAFSSDTHSVILRPWAPGQTARIAVLGPDTHPRYKEPDLLLAEHSKILVQEMLEQRNNLVAFLKQPRK